MGGRVDALLIHWVLKSSTVYVVKCAFLGLQRAPENSFGLRLVKTSLPKWIVP